MTPPFISVIGAREHQRGNAQYTAGRPYYALPTDESECSPAPVVVHVKNGVALTPVGRRLMTEQRNRQVRQ